jgi:hypothetical protein
MFLTCCSPRSTKARSRRSRTCSCAAALRQILARLGQCFEPGCDVDSIAKDVAILDDDVADIDALAKFDAALSRRGGIAGDHLPLHLDRAAHRVDDAGELDEETVAGSFDPRAMTRGCGPGARRFWDRRPRGGARAAPRACPLRPRPSARIAGDIGRENGSKPALYALFAHGRRAHKKLQNSEYDGTQQQASCADRPRCWAKVRAPAPHAVTGRPAPAGPKPKLRGYAGYPPTCGRARRNILTRPSECRARAAAH